MEEAWQKNSKDLAKTQKLKKNDIFSHFPQNIGRMEMLEEWKKLWKKKIIKS